MGRNRNQPDGGKPTDELHWRETYFIVFPLAQRPSLAEVQVALGSADARLVLRNPAGDDQGRFQSVLIESLEDHAAVEVSFEAGEAVSEQNLDWATQLQGEASSKLIQQFMLADARLDVVHFERLPASSSPARQRSSDSTPQDETAASEYVEREAWEEDEMGDPDFEMLDPTCLLTVVEALAALTGGLAFDPAAGALV